MPTIQFVFYPIGKLDSNFTGIYSFRVYWQMSSDLLWLYIPSKSDFTKLKKNCNSFGITWCFAIQIVYQVSTPTIIVMTKHTAFKILLSSKSEECGLLHCFIPPLQAPGCLKDLTLEQWREIRVICKEFFHLWKSLWRVETA